MTSYDLNELQKWYYLHYQSKLFSNKSFSIEKPDPFDGIELHTIGNPGWFVKINLNKTVFENHSFASNEIDRTEDDWCYTYPKNHTFEGAGGIHNLTEILTTFQQSIGTQYENNELTQSQRLDTTRLENWYAQVQNPEWDESIYLTIYSVANQGWVFKVETIDTPCEDRDFPEVNIDRLNGSWYHCFVADWHFVGFGGVFNLVDMVRTYLDWADQCKRDTSEPSNELRWTTGVAFHGDDAKTHFNKVTKEYLPGPHMHDRATPGGTRIPEPEELPAGYTS